MRIVIPGIDASQSGLGKSMPLIAGMPADSLEALYLFNEGTDGQTVSVFSDASGKGNHAALYGSYAAPIKRAWGLEVQSVNGLMLATNVPIGQQCTVIVAMESLLPGNETSVYQFPFGPSANNYSTNPAVTVTHTVSPTVNFSGHLAVGNYALFDGTVGRVVLGGPRHALVDGPTNNQPTVLGLRIDAPNDTVKLRANVGAELVVTRPEIGDHYAVDRGTIMLGAFANQAVRTAASPNARLFGAAIYSRALSDSVLATAMSAIRRNAEDAGIVFA